MTKIGLGTAAIGRPQYINIRQDSSDAVSSFNLQQFYADGITMLEAAYQAGIRYFDTAPGYGLAEQMLIDWLATKDDPAIEVATKWGYTYVANFDLNATKHEIKEHTVTKLNEQWEQSKKILPRLSIYQIHSATLESGVLENNEVLQRLDELKSENNLKIGVTVTGSLQNEILLKAVSVQIKGKPLFDIVQVTYNVFEQSLAGTIEQLKKSNIQVVIKEALANGRVFTNENFKHYRPHYNLLVKLAKKYNTGVDAIALRFVIDSIQPYMVLSGATSEYYLKQNLEAYNFKLDQCDIEQLQEFKVTPPAYWSERSKLNFN